MNLPRMLSVLGGGYTVIVLASVLLLPFVVLYIIEDVGGRKRGDRDPLLGTKIWLTFLLSVALQIVMAGLSWLLAIALDDNIQDPDNSMTKTAWGLVVGGFLAAAYPGLIYVLSGARDGGVNVLRKALGINVFLTGIIYIFTLTVCVILVFQGENAAAPFSVALIYALVTMGCGLVVTRPPGGDATSLTAP